MSPAVLLELHFLREIGRLVIDPDGFYEDVAQGCEIRELPYSLRDVVRRAAPDARRLSGCGDPEPDRYLRTRSARLD